MEIIDAKPEKPEDLDQAQDNRTSRHGTLKTNKANDYDYLANSATGMDCTGLMNRTAMNESEMEAYQDVYQYLPPNVKVEDTSEKDKTK